MTTWLLVLSLILGLLGTLLGIISLRAFYQLALYFPEAVAQMREEEDDSALRDSRLLRAYKILRHDPATTQITTAHDRHDQSDPHAAAAAFGSLGGHKRAEGMTAEQRRSAASKAAVARWKLKKSPTTRSDSIK